MSAFTPKWVLVDPSLQEEIINKAKEIGCYQASKQYASQVDMHPGRLYVLLNKLVKPNNSNLSGERVSQGREPRNSFKPKKEKELTAEEIILLDKLEKGEVTINEMSRIVAKRVFERMLKNPDDIKFIDFFRAELLRQKEEENKIKDKWGQELINRAFAGKLPPRNCPNCGVNLVPDSTLGVLDIAPEKEVGEDELIRSTGNNPSKEY